MVNQTEYISAGKGNTLIELYVIVVVLWDRTQRLRNGIKTSLLHRDRLKSYGIQGVNGMLSDRDRLIELLKEILPTRGMAGGIPIIQKWDYGATANKLLENGVILPPQSWGYVEDCGVDIIWK